MNWIKDLFGVEKPIIAMCHLHALPGDPDYDPHMGLDWIVENARKDMLALQNGGADAIMFSNERSLPYLTSVEPITVACMASIVSEIKHLLNIPFGINVLWDANASIDVAVATGAAFVREIFTGVYASDFGLWNTNCGAVVRHRAAVHGENIRLFFNIFPEASKYLSDRNIVDIARSTVFNARPDALCVSGLVAGSETSAQLLSLVKQTVSQTPVFANTGVNLSNVAEQLSIADGAVIGTAFKRDGYIWNEVDERRVREFMARVREVRQESKKPIVVQA